MKSKVRSQRSEIRAALGGLIAVLGLLAVEFCSPFSASAAALPALGDATKLPPPLTTTIDFDRDVWPILENSCVRCHGREKPKDGFRLDFREAALKGGEQGVAIVPGDSAKSPLIHYAARLVADMEMPPAGKGDPLTPDQVAVLRAWIDQGVKWGGNGSAIAQTMTVTPTLRYVAVSGDRQKFRELNWQKGGWSAGFEEFTYQLRTNDTDIAIAGHVIVDENNYGLTLSVSRPDLGFVRAGVDSYRKYFNDVGGYSPLFVPPQFSLNRDLYLDIGKAWIDFGLTLPDWPKLTVGYEYQWKNGSESTLQWGLVYNEAFEGRNLYPAAKTIKEHVNIVKLDVDYTVAGWRLEDSFRGEFYSLNTSRSNTTLLYPPNPTFNFGVTVREGQNSFTGANAFRAEKQFTDWLFASGGYLYSKLNGDASFALDGYPSLSSASTGVQEWRSSQIVLEREAHIFNLNGVLGPWEGFTLALGAQGEWGRQEGMTGLSVRGFDPNPFFLPVTINSDLDTMRVQESALLRYSKLPFTTLYAEARLEQASFGLYEEQFGADGLLRNTDATADDLDLRVGFSTSPWKSVTWSGYYRRVNRNSDFDNLIDVDDIDPSGYSAFITSLCSVTDEVSTKLALRPASWLRATLSYKYEGTDYQTGTDPVPGGISPGGVIQAGNYTANNYGVTFNFTGLRRLYLTTTFTYQDVLTVTAVNGNPSVVPYSGDIYSVLAAATYTLNPKTELFASFAYSRATFGQSNYADGLPTGINYSQDNVQGGVAWRVNAQLKTRLGYGFYRYVEPSSGGLNNYTAQMVFTSLSYAIP